MSIFAQCPLCRKKQSVKNKLCTCGENLDRAKKSERVQYWLDYYMPNGKRKRELVGKSIEDAQAAEGNKLRQKKENRFFDILPENKMTFSELATWYFKLEKVKALASYSILKIYMQKD